MTLAKPVVASLILVLAPCAVARSQVMIDVAKITCEQFTLFKVTDPKNIAIWLSGYYHGKRNDTVVDVQLLAENADKIKTYCRLKPEATVMQAVETVLRVPK